MAGVIQYNWKAFKEQTSDVEKNYPHTSVHWVPTVGQPWLHVSMNGKLRLTSAVVSYDPESGVVVTQNSVYVRG